MALTLGFYGGAGTVTGSKTLLRAGGRQLLVDCGLFQGLKELRLMNWAPPPFDPTALDAVLLTHTHVDHSGYLPRLVREGYRGPIFCTPATRDLAEILLRDAAKLQEEDARYANRKGFSKHHPALPLFTDRDVRAAMRQFRNVDYGEWFRCAGMSARFHNAGHILGSAFAEVMPEPGGPSVVFSGDVGQYGAPLHRDPEPRPECDALVMESTYGDRRHDGVPLIDQIREPFSQTLSNGGIVLIPAFAVARAQLVTLLLTQLMESGELPSVPVHIDSPMAVNVTETYHRYLNTGDLDQIPGGGKGLFPRQVSFHRSQQESQKLNHLRGPRIIISSSGMLSGGRVLHHLRRLLPDAGNLIVLVGFQASGTRGRALLNGATTLRMHGMDVPVVARFIHVEGLSAHADSDDLIRWLQSGPSLPRAIFLNHGEPEASQALSSSLATGGVTAGVPRLGEIVDLPMEHAS